MGMGGSASQQAAVHRRLMTRRGDISTKMALQLGIIRQPGVPKGACCKQWLWSGLKEHTGRQIRSRPYFPQVRMRYCEWYLDRCEWIRWAAQSRMQLSLAL